MFTLWICSQNWISIFRFLHHSTHLDRLRVCVVKYRNVRRMIVWKFLFQINLILVEWRLSRTIHRSHSHLLMLMDWLFTLSLAVRKPAEVWSMNRTSVRYRLVSRLGFFVLVPLNVLFALAGHFEPLKFFEFRLNVCWIRRNILSRYRTRQYSVLLLLFRSCWRIAESAHIFMVFLVCASKF